MKVKIFDVKLKSALLRNALLSMIWWVIFYPGFYSADSFAVLEMAKTGSLSNSWSAPWALLVRNLSLHGNFPGLVTCVLTLTLSISMTVFFYSFLPAKNASTVSFLLQATPLVSAMGITLWHDIPMTSGLLLVTTFVIRSIRFNAFTLDEAIKFMLPGMILITFRGNGLPTIILLFLFVFFFAFKRQGKKLMLVGILISISVTYFTNALLPTSKSQDYAIATGWIANDISCYASKEKGRGFVEKALPGIGTTQTWASAAACEWFSDAQISRADVAKISGNLVTAFIELVQEDPKFVLVTHLKRHEYLVPVPIFALPKPPFIHSTIEYADSGVKWAFPSLAEKFRLAVRAWNYGSFFFAYSGLWLLIIAFAWIKSRREEYLYVLVVSIVLSASLFVVAGISDARYALYILIAGQGIASNSLLAWLQTTRNKRISG
jgi:hypothetical protein